MEFYTNCYNFILSVNNFLSLPSIIIFLGTALILTIKTGFLQIRAIKKFINLLTEGIREKKKKNEITIGPFQALFTAMSTIGVGNIIGPSMAVSMGGPGALFWLIVYIFFGSVTKFTEVCFSVYSRKVSDHGDIIGGPTQYLRMLNPALGTWYAALTMFLFTVWSSIQVNTIACIAEHEGIQKWLTGLVMVIILLVVVLGGVKRIGSVTSKLVPFKFIIYISSVLFILFKNFSLLPSAIKLIFNSAFSISSVSGAIIGITILKTIREGIYKAIFITEAGTGTSSFAHSLSDAANPVDQGILAMYSGIADMLLCSLSGLLVIVTGVWKLSIPGNTLIYEAFKQNMPAGHFLLLFAMFLFVMTTLIGNTFNGSQSFAYFTNYKYIKTYFVLAAIIAYSGSVIAMPLLWNFMDIVLALVAIPNLIGLLKLAFTYPKIIKIN